MQIFTYLISVLLISIFSFYLLSIITFLLSLFTEHKRFRMICSVIIPLLYLLFDIKHIFILFQLRTDSAGVAHWGTSPFTVGT